MENSPREEGNVIKTLEDIKIVENIDKNDKNKLKSLIFGKIGYLCYFNQFSQKYSTCVILIFKKLNEVIFKKFTNTLNQNKNFLKFFKDITCAYQKFSTDLIGANSILSEVAFKEQILSDNINKMIEKTQESISSNFFNFSTVLTKKIITKGPFLKIADFFG